VSLLHLIARLLVFVFVFVFIFVIFLIVAGVFFLLSFLVRVSEGAEGEGRRRRRLPHA
jgi:heme/copper-type cytochrome/quinol oxidase subunit 2